MKKFTFILLAVAGSLAFVNCSNDDDKGGRDCFDCNMIVTAKYCYEDGKDYYTVEVMGQNENIPLNGASWSEIKAGLQEACDLSGL